MKTLIFSKNSWHYFVAHFGLLSRTSKRDLCTYIRHFLLGLSMLTIMGSIFSFVCAVVLYALGNLLYCLAYSLYYGQFMWNEAGKAGLLMVFVSVVGTIIGNIPKILQFVFSKTKNIYQKLLRTTPKVSNEEKKFDNFLINAYRGYKGKFCVPIKFEE